MSSAGPVDLLSMRATKPHYAENLVGKHDDALTKFLLTSASPALQPLQGAGPALLIHGSADPMVPVSQAKEMKRKFVESGVPVWLVEHVGGHQFNGLNKGEAENMWFLVGEFIRTEQVSPKWQRSLTDAAFR